jgi:hypothetical protein
MNEPITPTGPIKPVEPADPVERTYLFDNDEPEPPVSHIRWSLGAFLFIVFSVSALFYKFLFSGAFGHTSLMFIGIPAVLAILLAFAPRTKTITGGILRGITFALLVVAPLLGEGYLCILFAAPIFYVVGLAVGSLAEYFKNKKTGTLSCVALVLLPLSLEGVVPQLTFNRFQSVVVTQVVDAPSAAVESTLAHSPRVSTPLPRFLRIGFPRPLQAIGTGLNINDTRTIHFTGAEGDPPGDLVMRVTAHDPGHARFETISDSSKLTQWVRWQSSDVTWTPIDATHTAVTWRIGFNRQLDPYWYFTPWERFTVRQAAKYLIAANATPAEPHQ